MVSLTAFFMKMFVPMLTIIGSTMWYLAFTSGETDYWGSEMFIQSTQTLIYDKAGLDLIDSGFDRKTVPASLSLFFFIPSLQAVYVRYM